mmetsp:Transcript_6550/g.16058  ORF Transcript_6550/g.16058 Transcript_6550/m.16058 type:complete len:491 (-) Transcript_6550:42-1514(-)
MLASAVACRSRCNLPAKLLLARTTKLRRLRVPEGSQAQTLHRWAALALRAHTSTSVSSTVSLSSSSADSDASGDIDETLQRLLSTVARYRHRAQEAKQAAAVAAAAEGTAAEKAISMEGDLEELVQELRLGLKETAAPPTYVRLLETTLEPCWDWSANVPRLRTPHKVLQTLEQLNRRLLQLSMAESNADTRFSSLRMDLGAGHVRTEGTTSSSHKSWKHVEDGVQQGNLDRQYLSHEGVSGRTFSERERNSGKKRLERGVAAAAAYRRHGHAVVGEDDAADLEELEQRVEDQIQVAMAKGDFDNLDGQGLPLQKLQPAADNPFLDGSERLGFDLLQKHGFAPEWIEKQKSIRAAHHRAVVDLASAWLACDEDPTPRWMAHRAAYHDTLVSLNRQVADYNLICPVQKQLPLFVEAEDVRKVRREAQHILKSSGIKPSQPKVVAKPRVRLMTPIREVLRKSTPAASVDGKSVWTRVVDAFNFGGKPVAEKA